MIEKVQGTNETGANSSSSLLQCIFGIWGSREEEEINYSVQPWTSDIPNFPFRNGSPALHPIPKPSKRKMANAQNDLWVHALKANKIRFYLEWKHLTDNFLFSQLMNWKPKVMSKRFLFYCLQPLLLGRLSGKKQASLSRDNGNGTPKYNLALSQVFRNYPVLITMSNTGDLSYNCRGTNGFKVEIRNEWFIFACSRCRQKPKISWFHVVVLILEVKVKVKVHLIYLTSVIPLPSRWYSPRKPTVRSFYPPLSISAPF